LPGTCDPLADQGCAGGQTCALAAGVATCITPPITTDPTIAEVGAPCTSDDECAPGLICPPNRASGIGAEVGRTARYCLRPCLLDPRTSCGLGSGCYPASSTANGFADPAVPSGVGVCTEVCDPFAHTGCPENETCRIERIDQTRPFYCSTTTPSATPFADCAADYACGPDTLCDEAPRDASSPRVCRPLCDPAGNDTCPSGSRCVSADVLETGRAFGLCVRDATPH
jgi:hypothetical protein